MYKGLQHTYREITAKIALLVLSITVVYMILGYIPAYADDNYSVNDINIASQTSDSVTISWGKIDGASEYRVYRYNNSNNSFSKVGSVKKCTYKDMSLKQNTGYVYKVIAYKGLKKKTKLFSFDKVTAYTKATVGKITIEKTSIDEIICKWNKVKNSDGYAIKLYDSDKKFIKTIRTTSNKCTVSGLLPDTIYYVKMCSYHDTDTTQGRLYSDYSKLVKTKSKIMKPEVCLENVTDSSFELKWQEVKGADEYGVYEYNKTENKVTKIGHTSDFSWKVEKQKSGVTKIYLVKAFTEYDGVRYSSSYSDKITAGTLPSETEIVCTDFSSETISLAWDNVKSASGYIIYRMDEKTGKKIKLMSVKSSTSQNVTDLVSAKRYQLVVAPFRTMNGKNYIGKKMSNIVSIYTKTRAPIVSEKMDEDGKITISWETVNRADGYRVYRYNYDKKKYEMCYQGVTRKYVCDTGNNSSDLKFRVYGYVLNDEGKIQIGERSKVCGVYCYNKGIDISHWQGDIDWKKVAQSGVKFAIIKVGGRDRIGGRIRADEKYIYNIKEAKKYGIKVGVYFYSTAINSKEAIEEAKWTINRIKSLDIDFPVAFDYEDYVIKTSRAYRTTKKGRTNIAIAFLETIKAAGYQPLMYGNKSAMTFDFSLSKMSKYSMWVARYARGNGGKRNEADKPDIGKEYAIWQYSESGKVSGIDGDVDMNYCYRLYY